jgi:hypothetical protein
MNTETMFELAILDDNGFYFDIVGEYSSIESARESKNLYQLENPDDKYSIIKVTREILE